MTFNSNTGKLRKILVAVVATAVAGTTVLSPTVASARGFGHFGGWHGGGFGGFGAGLDMGFGVGLISTAIANSAAQQSCMQTQHVPLKNGLYKQVVVNAC